MRTAITRREFGKFGIALALGSILPRAARARLFEPYAVTPGDFAAYFDHDYFEKIRNFDKPHRSDVFLPREKLLLLDRVVRHLERVEAMAGHGNFQILCLDEALELGRDYGSVGAFERDALEFLEEIFYADATRYGFLGEKLLTRITDRIPVDQVVKVRGSGNYLYRGLPLETFERLRRDVGDRIRLTSGVRGVMKQFLLFLRKARDHGGNLSLASRSLAPPGYSFHGISDFDVGEAGLGEGNFTERFTATEVFRKLRDLDYFDLRYPRDNLLGVRFEPWHIRVDWRAV